MSEQRAPRFYGVRVGLVAAVFSIAQALLLYGSALGAYAAIRSLQQGLNIDKLVGQSVVDFFLIAPGLVPMLVVSYSSIIVAGVITLLLARSAGRMAAIAAGRHAGGARAGMWVWLISSLVWLAASAAVVALTHLDGTVTGVFSGTGRPEFTGDEITGLLVQEVIFALIGLGFCALAGSRGASGAALVESVLPTSGMQPYPFAMVPPPWVAMPPQTSYQPGPQAGLPAYPGAAYPPPLPWAPPQGVYPPPPSHYQPSQTSQPPAPTSLPPAGAQQPPAPAE
jgi:hypothetical protein